MGIAPIVSIIKFAVQPGSIVVAIPYNSHECGVLLERIPSPTWEDGNTTIRRYPLT